MKLHLYHSKHTPKWVCIDRERSWMKVSGTTPSEAFCNWHETYRRWWGPAKAALRRDQRMSR